jgi:hypothetical protein
MISSPVKRGRIKEGKATARFRDVEIMNHDLFSASASTAALPLPASPV